MNVEPRALKLRRLDAIRRRLPHATATAFSALVKEIATNPDIPLDIARNRDFIREARDNIANAHTHYGPILIEVPLIPASDDATEPPTMHIAHPHAMLWYATYNLHGWQQLFFDRLQRYPSTEAQPWKMILYSDEVTPGDPLGPISTRKVQCLYWSFLELGIAALSREDAWFHVGVKRSKDCIAVAGGLAQLIGGVLKACFPRHGYNLSKGGILLKRPDGTQFRFFAELHIFIQDGAAHKLTFQCKGDGGMKCCILCMNCVATESDVISFDGSNLLNANIYRQRDMDLASDSDLRGAIHRLC